MNETVRSIAAGVAGGERQRGDAQRRDQRGAGPGGQHPDQQRQRHRPVLGFRRPAARLERPAEAPEPAAASAGLRAVRRLRRRFGGAHATTEQPRPDERQQRRHERDAHQGHHERGERQRGPEDPEELHLAGQQRQRAAGHQRAGEQHQRRDPRRRRPCRREPLVAREQAPPRL